MGDVSVHGGIGLYGQLRPVQSTVCVRMPTLSTQTFRSGAVLLLDADGAADSRRDVPRGTFLLAGVIDAREVLDFTFGDCYCPDTSDVAEFKLLAIRWRSPASAGAVIARMTTEFHEAREYDSAAFDRFAEGLALRTGPSDAGGQDTLRQAIGHYYDAMFQPDPKRRAEVMLLANFKVGLHEQIRLQPHIAGAMNAPVTEDLFEVLGSP
jgi:hypothetical protein